MSQICTVEDSKLYVVRRSMIRRCYEYDNDYRRRGITVCDDWRNSFSAFRDWALSAGYKIGLTIDRIDNDKGYCPENCRWVTPAEQQRNRRDNIKINGLVLIDYLKSIGRADDYDTIRYRISTRHWPIETAINTPIKHRLRY